MDLSLQSKESLRQLMEVATGDSYAQELDTFGEPHEMRDTTRCAEGIVAELEKEEAAKKALQWAGGVAENGRCVKRMKVAQAAISRRVTATKKATFGHQTRTQAYGRRRWKTSTGALVVAEKVARLEN